MSEHPNIFYPQHANIYLKHIAKEILRMKCLDIDEKLDKRDLALVKISDTGAGEEYGEAASYSTWVGWRGKNFFDLSEDKQKLLSSQAKPLNICHVKEWKVYIT